MGNSSADESLLAAPVPVHPHLPSILPQSTKLTRHGNIGFFLATLIAHHLTPKPLALLSITGISTFRHSFFNSSYLIPPEPIPELDVEQYLREPVSAGHSIFDPSAVFYPDQLLPDGSRNPDFVRPAKVPAKYNQDPNRGLLYDYYLYENMFLALVDNVDVGFDWAEDGTEEGRAKLREWPVTVFVHGSGDDDVAPAVCQDAARKLGPGKGIYIEAKDQPHLFERTKYLEEIEQGEAGENPLRAVAKATAELDRIVQGA